MLCVGISGTDGVADIEGDVKVQPTWKESKKPYYVKDGKIYNAPVEGAVPYQGQRNAQQAAKERDNVLMIILVFG